MSSSIGMMIINIWENKSHVPNHQPARIGFSTPSKSSKCSHELTYLKKPGINFSTLSPFLLAWTECLLSFSSVWVLVKKRTQIFLLPWILLRIGWGDSSLEKNPWSRKLVERQPLVTNISCAPVQIFFQSEIKHIIYIYICKHIDNAKQWNLSHS